jgi:hypothetical protein
MAKRAPTRSDHLRSAVAREAVRLMAEHGIQDFRLAKRFEYQVFERKVRMTPDRVISVPSVRFEMKNEMVEAFVFQRDGIRPAPVSPVDGKPMRRASATEVSALV